MNTRLIVISGPLEGTVVPLGQEALTIGRSDGNQIRLRTRYTSRRHCVIARNDGAFILRDLGSSNGTTVNDLPVRERRLEHGDHIQIGDSLFVFLDRDEEEPTVGGITVPGGVEPLTTSSLSVPLEGSEESQIPAAIGTSHPSDRSTRGLSALFKVSAAISSACDARALERQLLETAFEIFAADRCAIVLADDSRDPDPLVPGMERGAAKMTRVGISPAIVRRVVRRGVAVLMNDIPEGEPALRDRPPAATPPRALLAVPLKAPGGPIGAICLESTRPDGRFTAWDLELLTAIAGVAAVGLENARRLQERGPNHRGTASGGAEQAVMVGESPAIRGVHDFIARVAPTEAAVLITGESGTGKELVVRAIHAGSRRARGPFVAINCGALVETLLESEMFGHERGAFTGAIARKKGKFELAHGGTLFMDEVASLAPPLQGKLLRVLQDHRIDPVGGTRSVPCDVRVIAATHRDLKGEMHAGRFREDLFYRLNVVSYTLPPLRERPEDIPLLASYFVRRSASACNRRVWGVSAEALACLTRYSWPGNIRELENAIERAVVIGGSDWIMPEDLPEGIVESQPEEASAPTRFHGAIREAKKRLVLQAFRQAKGRFVVAARLLGIHPNSLHRLVRSLNLREVLKESP